MMKPVKCSLTAKQGRACLLGLSGMRGGETGGIKAWRLVGGIR